MARKSSIDIKLTPDELEVFYDQSSERNSAIVLTAIVENHLTSALELLMRPESALKKEVFSPSGPLGPFGNKIKFAYLIRLIDKEIYDDLIAVSKVRNKFAHNLSIKSFDDPPIREWVENMHVYSTLKAIKNKHRTRTPANLIDRSMKLLLQHAFLSTHDSFRECLRLLIHHISDTEEEIRSSSAFATPFRPL